MAEGSRKRKATCLSNAIEFFKVYFSCFSSRQLKFPPALGSHLKRTLNNATLKDHNGKVWNVRLEKAESDLIITDGWADFATYHCLADGDFLVFKYDGNCHFDVESFTANGFKRAKTLGNETFTAQVKEEVETEAWENSSRPTCGCKMKDSEMPLDKAQISGRRKQFVKRKIIAGKVAKGNLAKAASFVKTKNPYFVTTIPQNKRSQYAVHVPRSMVRDHGIKLKNNMKLRNENGKLWPVKLNLSYRSVITSGWKDFCRANKVSVGDKCIIEFIPTKGDASRIMQVQVVHRERNKRSKSRKVGA